MLVPEREGARNDLDAVASRALLIPPAIRRQDVDVVRVDMAATHPVARQQTHNARHGQVVQPKPT
jgi:hypothetical protein